MNDSPDWRKTFTRRLPFFGHRNWIAVVDSAYPAQSSAGVETLVAEETLIPVLETVLAEIARSRHVKPVIYTDTELASLDDSLAPGAAGYKRDLAGLLDGHDVISRMHEEIIYNLDTAARTFQVMVVKTSMSIPYTSVFLQLDCRYWNVELEAALRARMPDTTR